MNTPTEPTSSRRAGSAGILLVAGVHLMLLAPLLCLLLRVPELQGLNEKRALTDPPAWHSGHVAAWTAQAEAWLNDHFPQRARVIEWNSLVRERYLESANSNVIVGRDGWLYFAGDGTPEDILGRSPLDPAQLAQWARVLEGRRAWLAQRGIRYLFVVAPNKSTIYPEHLPAVLRLGARSGRLDQLMGYLKANTGVAVLDLRQPLMAAKAGTEIYWPWDSHWNGDGLLLGSDEVVRAVAGLGVRVGADDSNRWLSVRSEDHLFDCVELLGLRGAWPVRPVPVVSMFRPPDLKAVDSPLNALAFWAGRPAIQRVLTTERTSGESRVAMFCDSFYRAGGLRLEALTDLPLQLRFRRFTSIWDVSDFQKISAVAGIEKPDVIVDQTTERLLGSVPADDPELEKARLAPPAR